MDPQEVMQYLRAPTAADSTWLENDIETLHPDACRIVKQAVARLARDRDTHLVVDLSSACTREEARDVLVVCAIPRLAQTLAVTHRIHLAFSPPGLLLVAPIVTGTEALQRMYAMPAAVRNDLLARVRAGGPFS